MAELIFEPKEPDASYLPCDFCNFYASDKCRECLYFSDCVASITGEGGFGGCTKKEATTYADRIYDEWELEKYRTDYPWTWRIRLPLHRLHGKILKIWYRVKSWKIKRKYAK